MTITGPEFQELKGRMALREVPRVPAGPWGLLPRATSNPRTLHSGVVLLGHHSCGSGGLRWAQVGHSLEGASGESWQCPHGTNSSGAQSA